jgi:hypothetical protein
MLSSNEQAKIYKLNFRLKWLRETHDLYIVEKRIRDAEAIKHMMYESLELRETIKRGGFVAWSEIDTKDIDDR